MSHFVFLGTLSVIMLLLIISFLADHILSEYEAKIYFVIRPMHILLSILSLPAKLISGILLLLTIFALIIIYLIACLVILITRRFKSLIDSPL